jgi:hypothetical protein
MKDHKTDRRRFCKEPHRLQVRLVPFQRLPLVVLSSRSLRL